MSGPDDPEGATRPVDPASTFLGVERREESLSPSSVPTGSAPPPAPRRWDARSGRWESHGGPVLPDPSELPAADRSNADAPRFEFPEELAHAPDDLLSPPEAAPAGPLDRLLGWLGRGRSDRRR